MKIKAILTDLDGTLIDSIPLIMASDKEAIEHFGFKVSHQELRDLSQMHSREIAFHLMDTTKRVIDLFAFINYRRRTFLKLLKERKHKDLWWPDAKWFLKETAKGFKIGVITGSRKMFVKEVFDAQTKKSVKTIITSDDVQHKKPDIEPLLLALKKLKLRKSEVIFIGDSEQDGLMCQRLGVKFIAKEGGISTEHELRKYNPVFVGKNFSEIKSFIDNTHF